MYIILVHAKYIFFSTVLIFLSACITEINTDGCSMYGHCNYENDSYQNCVSEGSLPQPLDGEAKAAVQNHCPFFFEGW